MSNLTMDEAALGKLFLLAGQTVESVAMGTSKWAVAAFLMRIVVQPWYGALDREREKSANSAKASMVPFVLDLNHHGSECIHGHQCVHTVHSNSIHLGRSCADAKMSLELGDDFLCVLLLVCNS